MKKKERTLYIAIIISLIMLFVLIYFLIRDIQLDNEFEREHSYDYVENFPDNYVVKVIDGDTFELANGDKIRLICVDAPEKNEANFSQSKEFLESLILYKEVRLEKDVSETDSYGRLLRYVYRNVSVNGVVSEIFINKILVQENYADVWEYGNDTKRCGEISGK